MRKAVMAAVMAAVVVVSAACGALPGPGGSGGGTGGSGGSGGAGGASGLECTTGTLWAGNPKHTDPMSRPAEGTSITADPPLLYRQLLFSNGQLITHVGQEIWRANLSDKLLRKLAGTERTSQALITGPCAQARFANIFHIALASDGSLFVSDQTANAILKITDPLGPNCTVARWAGAPMDHPEGTFNPGNPPNVGNVNGPGAMAKFGLPERMALDGSDNIYVWDNGNNSIRKIANDADHTVSTFVPSITPGGAAVISLVFLDGKLFMYGIDGNDVFLNSYDPAGAKTVLFKGRADIFDGDSSDSKTIGGMTTDGTGLLVVFNGQLFRIDTAGKVALPALAGVYRPGLDFTSGYDPKAANPADKVQLITRSQVLTAGLSAFITLDANKDIFVSASNTNSYVMKLDCE